MYIGRFAPSPTGPLHLGSLMSALASYLDAKHNKGQWIIRIEDLDPPREVAGAAEAIISTLERFGMISDQPVILQSHRHSYYAKNLEQLRQQGLTYPCYCTRRDMQTCNSIHPYGQCPNAHRSKNSPFSIRVKTSDTIIAVNDLCQKTFDCHLSKTVGDFILYRKDKLYAYHLAVTTDDALQNITHIVRGADLLDSTPQQLYLQTLLGYPHPSYLHIPVITHQDGSKFSKQTFAPSIDSAPVAHVLIALLNCLGQNPPPDMVTAPAHRILHWATHSWQRHHISQRMTIPIQEIDNHFNVY